MISTLQNKLTAPEFQYIAVGFVVALVVIGLLEWITPARSRDYSSRTIRNVSLWLINGVIKLLIPISLGAASLYALFENLGLFNQIRLGLWTKVFLSWLIIDLAVYWLHRAYHSVPLLWRLHRVHHSDQFVDFTTAFRTHPAELLLTLLFKAALVVMLGMPLLGVILYELVVAILAIWAHANIRLPQMLSSWLQCFVVTPNFHQQHHRATAIACRVNFGLGLTIWDRIFGTLAVNAPEDSRCHAIEIQGNESLGRLLTNPLVSEQR